MSDMGAEIEEPVVDVSKDPTYPYSVLVRGETRRGKWRASYFAQHLSRRVGVRLDGSKVTGWLREGGLKS